MQKARRELRGLAQRRRPPLRPSAFACPAHVVSPTLHLRHLHHAQWASMPTCCQPAPPASSSQLLLQDQPPSIPAPCHCCAQGKACTRMHTHTHARTHTHTHIRTHTCTHIRMHTHIQTRMHIHMHVHTHVHTHARTTHRGACTACIQFNELIGEYLGGSQSSLGNFTKFP